MAIDFMLPLRIAYLAIGTSVSMTYYALKGMISRPTLLPYKRYLIARLMWCMRAYDKYRKVPNKLPKTTLASYEQYTISEERAITPQITKLDHGAQLLWFGPEKADKVIFYLHGGAYVNAAVSGHYKLLEELIAYAAKHGHSLRAAVLGYDLASKSPWPIQLIQATAGLHKLTQEFNYPLSKIIVMGDSAGGHLALALLSHALHPRPDISRIALSDVSKIEFAGLYLISPWVTFKQDAPSMYSNYGYDFLHKPALKISSDELLDGAADDNYSDFLLPDQEWWKGLVTKSIGFTAGGYEIFRDDIVRLAKIFQTVIPETELVDVPGELHDQAVINLLFGREKAESFKVLEGWILRACDSS